MEYLLFTIYLLLALWWFPKINFVSLSSINPTQLRLLLAFKILTGLVCAFYFEHFSSNFDYTSYNTEGKLQYKLLLSNPVSFFTDFRRDWQAYGAGGVFATQNSFWGYLRFNLMYKLIGLLNLATKGDFYLNSAAFSSLVFFAHIAFYRIYQSMYPTCKRFNLLLAFFLPSLLLYTACIHKDGLVYMSLGVISFIVYRVLTAPESLRLKHLPVLLAALVSIFLFRNYVLVALLPAICIAFVWKYGSRYNHVGVLICYGVFFALFFLSAFTSIDLPAAVIQRKADFEALGEANTNIPMPELLPGLSSFMVNLPQALNHVLLRPYPWEFSQLSVKLTAFELLFYQLLILLFVLYRKRPHPHLAPFTVFGIALFFHMVLIIGYTIPNVGAIVRYRSIFWIFLLAPVVCNIDWAKLAAFFVKKPR